ncbi:MAG: substrate-binding domain-containing protein [Spirochaetaceae bacterium]|nr:substrate-binding domain-containing protein [Spirochaetaceae bacterium]
MKKIYLAGLMLLMAFAVFASGAKAAGGAAEAKYLFYYAAPHPYFVEVEKGVTAWEQENGITLHRDYGSDWTADTLTNKLQALAATGYNLISVYPLPGVNGAFQELTDRGIKIINFGADSSTSNPLGQDTTASFCVATDVKQAAYDAAIAVIDKMGGRGTLLNVLEVLTDPNTVLRQEGVKKACDDKGIAYRETAGIDAIDAATQKISDILSANPDAQGIVTTGQIATAGLVSVLNGMNRDIVAVGIDEDEATMTAIRSGKLYGTIAQNPYGHGYLPLEILKELHNGAKIRPGKYFINAGVALVTKDNIDSYSKDITAVTNRIKASLFTEYLTK